MPLGQEARRPPHNPTPPGRQSRMASSTASSTASRSAWGAPASGQREGTPRWRRFLRRHIVLESETTTATSSPLSTSTMTPESATTLPSRTPPPSRSPRSPRLPRVVPDPHSPRPHDPYDEVRRQFAAYLANPCVHGLKYIARSDYPVAVRALWALLFVLSIVGFFSLAYVQAFSSSSMTRIYVKSTSVPLENYSFPSVTVCPMQSINKNPGLALLRLWRNGLNTNQSDGTLDAMYVRLMVALQNFRYPEFAARNRELDVEALKYLGAVDVRDFIFKTFPPCRNVFKTCWWQGKTVDCCSIFDLQESHFGFCYSFNSCTCLALTGKPECKPRSGSEHGLGLSFVLYKSMESEAVDPGTPAGAYVVVVGSPYEVPQPVSGHLILADGGVGMFTISASLSVQLANKTDHLPWRARNCKFVRDESLSITGWYTQQSCIEACRLQIIRQRCGCTPPFFNARVLAAEHSAAGGCNATGLECIFRNKYSLRRTNSVPVKLQQELDGLRHLDNDTGFDCQCPPDCDVLMYSTEKNFLGVTRPGDPYYLDDVSALVKVTQRNQEAKNVVYEKLPNLSVAEFLADLGNIAGLFLGISVLSVFEFVYVTVSCLKTLYDGLKCSKM